jgi:hypothetical protein
VVVVGVLVGVGFAVVRENEEQDGRAGDLAMFWVRADSRGRGYFSAQTE